MKKFLLMGVLAAMSVQAQNLIPNGSFEGGFADWRFLSMKGKTERLERSTEVYDGDEGLTVKIIAPETEKLISGRFGAWGRVHKTVQLEPGKTYRISVQAWLQNGFDGIAGVMVKAGESKQFFANVKISDKWQEITGEFKPTAAECSVFLNVMGNKGEVTFDEIALLEVKPDTAILKNGNFERGGAAWKFSAQSGGVEGKAVRNQYEMKVTALPKEGAKPDYAWGRLHQNIELEAGKKYSFKVKVMSGADYQGRMAVWVKGADGKNLLVFNVPPTGGAWKELGGEFTAAGVKGAVFLNMMGKAGTVCFGEAAITEQGSR